MNRYLIKRLFHSIIVILGIGTIVFIITHLTGDPTNLLLPPEAGEAQRKLLWEQLGLGRPLYIQFLEFLKNMVQGDFGQSFRHQMPAMDLILSALPATIKLTLAAMTITIVISIPVGILSATRPGSLYDRAGMFFALLGQSMPVYWAGLMMILLFAVKLGWLPSISGAGFKSIILPACTLGMFSTAAIARFTRSSMLDVLDADYVTTARIKGLSEYRVVLKHALKNAAIPIITMTSLQMGRMLAGAVIVETIFSWPGLGRMAVQAIYNRDYPVVQAAVFVASVIFVLINLLVDILYTYIDPRIKYK
ncbi:MAG: ABC transporter permease [Desulfobacteraceae bacterium]|nr:MAG: ABC transporter permease [Desulfobacteraceae bacterium]